MGTISKFDSSIIIKFPIFLQTRASSFAPMAVGAGSTRRPTCASCSRPIKTCLCARLPARSLNNSVAVTILQHTAERKHPLNTARIAKIGLKNVDVLLVSDVSLGARFVLRFLDETGGKGSGDDRNLFDAMIMEEGGHKAIRDVTSMTCNLRGAQFFVEKHGAISSINDPTVPSEHNQLKALDQLLELQCRATKGFIGKKLRKTGLEDGAEEVEEFDIRVPCGSVLLFPSESSVGLEEIDFQVNNLIVLDGTWAKARRMYNENPWLRLVPHVKLDVQEGSLYREVRQQPQPGYLSTIESVVYAMKALGCDIHGGLDGLLGVFESMVGDQRQGKNDRVKKTS